MLPATRDKETNAARLGGLNHGPSVVAEQARKIYDTVLARSKNVGKGNFTAIAPIDLRLLFDLYDAAFFEGQLGEMLRADGAELSFQALPADDPGSGHDDAINGEEYRRRHDRE